jgi:transposase
MAMERLSMLNIREILRQKRVLKRTHREVSQSVGCSPGTVGHVILRADAAKLEWEEVERLGDLELEVRVYGPKHGFGNADRVAPDPLWIYTEYQKPGVTLELLHIEYLEREPKGYRYTQFCKIYSDWLAKQRISMRQVHKGGEKLFVDYSGKKPHIVDQLTGERTEVELFVSALGASSYTYAEATKTQKLADWLASHVRAFEYYEGVARSLVPDQLRSAVSGPCRYDPVINRSYLELAQHYGTFVLPARPRKPKDKAKVEVAVQVAQRWILAAIRNQTFFSLEALNARIRELLERLNNRPMKHLGGQSRRERFLLLDKPSLMPLPERRFELCEWKTVTPNIDYHVELHKHWYSVPYTLRGEQVDARLTASTVEIYFNRERVAAHVRSDEPYRFTTIKEHMPKAHQAQLEWNPTRLIGWGKSIGAKTGALIEAIITERPHPEHGYRTSLGILRLESYGKDRLEAACARALAMRLRSRRQIESVLKNGLDRMPLPALPQSDLTPAVSHDNVRGAAYYNPGEE